MRKASARGGGASRRIGCRARSAADDPLDPVRVAPDTHKVAFENAFVRVLDVRLPPAAWSRATATRTG